MTCVLQVNLANENTRVVGRVLDGEESLRLQFRPHAAAAAAPTGRDITEAVVTTAEAAMATMSPVASPMGTARPHSATELQADVLALMAEKEQAKAKAAAAYDAERHSHGLALRCDHNSERQR